MSDQHRPPPPPGDAYGYGGQQYAGQPHGGPPQTSSKATVALVVAIAGLFVCAPIGAVAGLVLASQASNEIKRSGGGLTGEGLVMGARIVSIISAALTALAILAIVAITFLGRAAEDDLEQIDSSIERIVLPSSAAG